jgi:hypothetical protein
MREYKYGRSDLCAYQSHSFLKLLLTYWISREGATHEPVVSGRRDGRFFPKNHFGYISGTSYQDTHLPWMVRCTDTEGAIPCVINCGRHTTRVALSRDYMYIYLTVREGATHEGIVLGRRDGRCFNSSHFE